MGVYIIGVAIFALCTLVFQYFWKAVLKFCYYLLLRSIDVIKKIIVATKRFGKCVMYLYRRYRNGKVVRVKVELLKKKKWMLICFLKDFKMN